MKIDQFIYSDLPQIEEIFWLTSAVDKAQLKDPQAFQEKYLNYYIKNYPELCLVMRSENNLLGYICGSPNSLDESWLTEKINYYQFFKDDYIEYPAELHINCHPSAQGKGVGSKLINAFCHLLQDKKIKGVHLLTDPKAKNVSFYLKNSFRKVSIHNQGGSDILLLGKSLQ